MVLKPQDVYVALKIAASRSDRAPYHQLALELIMSPSEVHASVQRAQAAHLLHGPRHHIPKCPLMDPPAHRRSFARIPS